MHPTRLFLLLMKVGDVVAKPELELLSLLKSFF